MAETDILRLTEATFNQSSFVLYTTPVSSVNGLSITFDFYAYQGTGADGISFFFLDGNQSPKKAGGSGGSLGYAPLQVSPTTLVPGIEGGYLGIGFDEFGNYSAEGDGRVGGIGKQPDSVSIRGSVATNYNYLTGNQTPLPISLDNPTPTATRETSKRTAQIDLSPSGDLSVKVDLNADGDFIDAGENVIPGYNVITTGENGVLPQTFKFGFAASTGGNTNIHEVGNFKVTTADGTAIPGDFTSDLTIIGSDQDDKPPTTSGNDTVQAGGGSDTLTGQAGNDVLVGGPGADISTGGVGSDRFVFSGTSRAEALRDSIFRFMDKIGDFKFRENDKFQIDSDNNVETLGDLPKRLFNAGKQSKGPLLKAVKSAYADKNRKRRGDQKLLANEAVFFKLGKRSYLSINDSQSRFTARNDLLAEVSGIQFKPGDAKLGALQVSNYFI